MLKEFVDRLLSLSAVQRHQIHGLEYADRGLVVVEPPMTEALKTVTLTGLVDLIRAKIQGLEVEQWVLQPESEFIFRLRSQAGAIPECALFEADGGKWKLDAVLAIKAWLEQQQLGLPVVA